MRILLTIGNRAPILFSLIMGLIVLGCDRNDIPPDDEFVKANKISDGFSIQFGDSIVINHGDIEYYDFSTHMVYLKDPHPLFQDQFNLSIANMPFSVYAFKKLVYSGTLFPGWASSIPAGAFIDWPSFYPAYVIKINFRPPLFNTHPDTIPDPRVNDQIANTLKKYDQLHAGLSCTITDIEYIPDGKISFTYTINNEDTFNYYILSPDRMGSGLFHYFTNGLLLFKDNGGLFQHQTPVISPEPWDSWSADWLDLLENNTSRSYHIIYEDFDPITPGQYDAYFSFPGLSHVDQEKLIRSNGRIWLGEIAVSKEIVLE